MRTPLDLRVYLVTDTGMSANHGLARTVELAVRGGVTVVQLRDHDVDDDTFVRMGRELAGVLEGSGVPLLLDDRVHLVEAVGADGAHVGQTDTPVEEARQLLGPDRYLGLSIGTMTEIDRAKRLPPETIDYIGIGPVRATSTKPDHGPVLGFGGAADLASASPWPGVAIGGIDDADAARLRSAGLAGMAVVSAICGQPDPRSAAEHIRRAWDAA